MNELAKQYSKEHRNVRVSKVNDYRFYVEEFDPKTLETKKSYWVCKSYFFKER